MSTRTVPSVPRGLTPASRRLWAVLTTEHHFEVFELTALERSLRWFDKADAWLQQAEEAGVEARAAAVLVKQSMDASNCGLRYWRTLKFTDGTPARRPGRPAGPDWSAKRKLQQAG
jgi:hypothetical protein